VKDFKMNYLGAEPSRYQNKRNWFLCISLYLDFPWFWRYFFITSFICILANGIHTIPGCPKFTAPKQFFHFGMEPENFLCGNALDSSDYLFRGIRRNAPNQEMNMVPSRPISKKWISYRSSIPRQISLNVTETSSLRTVLLYLIGQTKWYKSRLLLWLLWICSLIPTKIHIITLHPRQRIRGIHRLKTISNN